MGAGREEGIDEGVGVVVGRLREGETCRVMRRVSLIGRQVSCSER